MMQVSWATNGVFFMHCEPRGLFPLKLLTSLRFSVLVTGESHGTFCCSSGIIALLPEFTPLTALGKDASGLSLVQLLLSTWNWCHSFWWFEFKSLKTHIKICGRFTLVSFYCSPFISNIFMTTGSQLK
jgi:hypothetical protein